MDKRSSKAVLITAPATAIICAAVRYFQIVSLTDTDTGFFFNGAELGGAMIYILLAASAAVLAVLVFLGKKKGENAYFLASDGMGENATRYLGISEIVCAAAVTLNLFFGSSSSTLTFIMNAAAAVVMFVSGFTLVGRIIPPAYTGHVKLIAAVYFFFRTTELFGSDLIAVNHAEILIKVLALDASAVFIAFLGRFYSRIETKNSRVCEIIAALFTFLLTFTSVGSDILAKLSGGEIAEFADINIELAGTMILSGTYLAVVYLTERKKDIVPVVEM